jgi:hypothetical protein
MMSGGKTEELGETPSAVPLVSDQITLELLSLGENPLM